MSDKDKLITTQELAARWSMHPNTLANWRHQKRGPKYVKIGRMRKSPVYYRLKDILEYENKSIVKTGS
jgi:transposase-like protein